MSYIGNDLRSGRSEIYYYTSASGGETTITSLSDGRSINYTVGWCTVFLNGVRMHDTDVTLTSGSSVVFGSALSAGDVVIVEASHTFSVSDSVPKSGGTFDGAVTFETISQPTSKNISGTLTENALYLSNAFVMTGNITVSGKTTLARITDDDATTPFLTDTNGQTVTVGGTLTLGTLVQ
jgi:hypothetical protein